MIRAVIFDMYETLITHYNSSLYFSEEMAVDAGIPLDIFRKIWRATDYSRTVGELTLEQVLVQIFKEYHGIRECESILDEDSQSKIQMIVEKRTAVKEELFHHLHSEIIPMLMSLKEDGYQIGLISNCFSEEAEVIRKSILFPYFDALCLSYEQGVAKPDERIYKKCMDMLVTKPEECLYVGDGGSRELEAARDCGMHPVQAVWYLKEGTMQPVGRKPEFLAMETPMEVLSYIREHNVRQCHERK